MSLSIQSSLFSTELATSLSTEEQKTQGKKFSYLEKNADRFTNVLNFLSLIENLSKDFENLQLNGDTKFYSTIVCTELKAGDHSRSRIIADRKIPLEKMRDIFRKATCELIEANMSEFVLKKLEHLDLIVHFKIKDLINSVEKRRHTFSDEVFYAFVASTALSVCVNHPAPFLLLPVAAFFKAGQLIEDYIITNSIYPRYTHQAFELKEKIHEFASAIDKELLLKELG